MNTFSSSLVSSVITITFSGLSGAGSISIPGLAVGDIVVNGSVNGLSVWPSFASFFEPVISAANQFQQLGGNLVGPNFTVYLLRPVL